MYWLTGKDTKLSLDNYRYTNLSSNPLWGVHACNYNIDILQRFESKALRAIIK